MTGRMRRSFFGCVAVLGGLGCASVVRPLGDEPAGGGEAGTGGSLPVAGTPATGGADGVTSGTSGTSGTAGAASHEPNVGGTAPECWSPIRRPRDVVDTSLPGCACEADEAACPYFCREGRWEDLTALADCAPGGASCQVGEWIYPPHYTRVPSPYDCNTCTCLDGELVDCTANDCVNVGCPEGEWPARNCRRCGTAGGCEVHETGCFSDAGCEDGLCPVLCF